MQESPKMTKENWVKNAQNKLRQRKSSTKKTALIVVAELECVACVGIIANGLDLDLTSYNCDFLRSQNHRFGEEFESSCNGSSRKKGEQAIVCACPKVVLPDVPVFLDSQKPTFELACLFSGLAALLIHLAPLPHPFTFATAMKKKLCFGQQRRTWNRGRREEERRKGWGKREERKREIRRDGVEGESSEEGRKGDKREVRRRESVWWELGVFGETLRLETLNTRGKTFCGVIHLLRSSFFVV